MFELFETRFDDVGMFVPEYDFGHENWLIFDVMAYVTECKQA